MFGANLGKFPSKRKVVNFRKKNEKLSAAALRTATSGGAGAAALRARLIITAAIKHVRMIVLGSSIRAGAKVELPRDVRRAAHPKDGT